MKLINSRADLESLRGTDAFEPALAMLYGTMTMWRWDDDQWVAVEDLSAVTRLDYTKAQFLDEIAPFNFPDPVAPDPRPDASPSPVDVIEERERRLALGFDYDFGDERGAHRIGTTETDMRRWMMEVTPMAQVALNAGQTDMEIGISTDTGPCTVTAAEWQQVLATAAALRQPVYQASFALQAMDPIPKDFEDDKWWP